MARAPATRDVMLLSGSRVAGLMSLDDCILAVEEAFRLHGQGGAPDPAIVGVHTIGGGFHIKAGLYDAGTPYFVTKLNANFMGNRLNGLPGIQGFVALCNAQNGTLLALMDSIEITALRTAAATAVAAKHLARQDARVVTICGCGTQGRVQLRALARVRSLSKAWLVDENRGTAEAMARDLAGELSLEMIGTEDLEAAVRQSDICVTCTPATRPILYSSMVNHGTFIAAVGADAEHKQELDPALFRGATIVTDVTAQCVALGDLHHAIAAGAVSRNDVHAELGEVVCGNRPGRTTPLEITIFDSTGMALQDAAAAALVYERALAKPAGMSTFCFAS